jgi:hypothetical protein
MVGISELPIARTTDRDPWTVGIAHSVFEHNYAVGTCVLRRITADPNRGPEGDHA